MEVNYMDDRSWQNKKNGTASKYQVNFVKLALVEKDIEWKRVKMLVRLLINWSIKSMLEG